MKMWKIREGYVVREIGGESYLLPYGQNVADHRRGMKLNDSGVFLWKLLQEVTNEDELLMKAAAHYRAKPCEWPQLLMDIRFFMDELAKGGILVEDEALPVACEYVWQLGTLRIGFSGSEEFITDELKSFLMGETEVAAIVPDCYVVMHDRKPIVTRNGRILLRNQDLVVAESDDYYLFLYETAGQLLECHLAKDLRRADFYYLPPVTLSLAQHFFHALRTVFLVIAKERGLHVLHAASILYKGKAWLFSGKSGTGKTTHTNIWKELYQATILNGDLNMMGIEKGQAVVYGLPWCGTSGIYTREQYPLGGIVLLKQGGVNRLLPLSEDEGILFLAQRLISPDWTIPMLEQNLAFAERIARLVPVMRLLCTKDTEAVDVIKAAIDGKAAYHRQLEPPTADVIKEAIDGGGNVS
jgi:hypothetical protein